MTFLDTHVVVWLYAGETGRLSARGRQEIATQPLFVSPIVVLELQYLFEIGRITVRPSDILATLAQDIGLTLCDDLLEAVVSAALGATWTRDPFDRLIVAHATVRGAALLSKDGAILENCPTAIWD